jgi:glycosyltransferase involved in cell wall biosynthesis
LLVLAPLLRVRGLRVVYDVHENVPADLLYKPYLGRVGRHLASWGYCLVERLLIGGVATVHVLDEIARNYRMPKVVVRNLPRLDAPVAPPRPADRPPGRARIVYCGIIAADRGAVTMIQAAEELRRRGADCDLLLIGNILDPQLRRAMTETIDRADLADRVRLAGPMPYAQAMAEVAASDVGLCLMHPSPNNLVSLPNKIFEYMWMGLPVVVSDFPKWREYVGHTGAGLQADPTSPRRIADAVQWLLDRPQERRRMGESGKRAVADGYCWEKEQGKLLEFYRKLLG